LTLKSTFDGMEEAYSASHTMALGRWGDARARAHIHSLQEADYSRPSCGKFTISGVLLPDTTFLYGMYFSPKLNYFLYNLIRPTDIQILNNENTVAQIHTSANTRY
jgi:hypothetical protein